MYVWGGGGKKRGEGSLVMERTCVRQKEGGPHSQKKAVKLEQELAEVQATTKLSRNVKGQIKVIICKSIFFFFFPLCFLPPLTTVRSTYK